MLLCRRKQKSTDILEIVSIFEWTVNRTLAIAARILATAVGGDRRNDLRIVQIFCQNVHSGGGRGHCHTQRCNDVLEVR